MKGSAFPAMISSGFLIESIACKRAMACGPARDLELAIARGFIDAMGGTITPANRDDRSGAMFTIALPVPADPGQLDTAA